MQRRPERIVSLIASATEIVDRLGLVEELVGRSHECDYPPQVLSLPKCSSAKLDVNGSSLEIDQRVKDVLKDATSVYNVDVELLNHLEPTLILTQTQCEVCAVSLKDVEAAMCAVVTSQPRIVACEPNWLSDVWKDIERVAVAAGVAERGAQLIADSQRRLDEISQTASKVTRRPRVACIEWMEPIMAAGNWVPELVTLAGGENLFGVAGQHSPWMTWNELLASDPDIVLVMPCGFDIPRIQQEWPCLAKQPEWAKLRAVQGGQVYIVDGNQYFNRPGPRLVESAEILAEIFHPQIFSFGHRGNAYIPSE
ncbi:periplasmic binding protein [Planctopirus limnophila DSM 3776]|uniref:Periplasmic binding protein n=1 Tax=Planctopirus limnophila (strain ATCC 43296 / DSM 3776 / IFAM 1008 / Mu 290) TaxID=521674 RepID=D5SYF4_PLAL2|nr:cobalamin-binding protein [Planctopirus limnophila]ADG67682.1 periplasmic binding protein [Planctopirus limnophila DSM 3776]